MPKTPTVSVLLSVYNAEVFLREAINSVLGQTLSEFEFLIFEDCSKDLSLEILQSYDDPRIRLVLNDKNLGLVANLATGMEIARGKYVARMDADDICEPDRLAKQVAFLETNTDIGILGTAVDFFDESGSLGIAYQPEDHDSIKCALLLGFTLFHPSVMMRIDSFRDYGLNYDSDFRYSEDHDLWVRACRRFHAANLTEPLLRMRSHKKSWTKAEPTGFSEYSSRIRKRQLDELGVDYTDKELEAFNWGASPQGKFPDGVLQAYDSIGMKILAANAQRQIFDRQALPRQMASKFHRLCTIHLQDGHSDGRYFWRSELRKHTALSPRQWLGILFRSMRYSGKAR